MDINNEDLKKDLEEQYAMLEEEIKEDKKNKRYLLIFIFFIVMFLFIFGTTFSYYKLYEGSKIDSSENILKDLYVEGYEDAFDFDPSVHRYTINVSEGTTSISVKYVLNGQQYEVEIKGNENLKPGVNEVEIIIKDKDGNEIIYIIDVIVEGEDINNDLSLKNLSVTNHELTEKFQSNKTIYKVNDISENEDKIIVNFELANIDNTVSLRLNGSTVTRKPEISENKYSLALNVNSELVLGSNKLEIIVKDKDGNQKTYYLFLIVNKMKEEKKVIEISVDYGNDNGNYIIDSIIPGWESLEKQHFTITNSSNYDTNVDINWTNVTNNFVNFKDLEYILYKENKIIKTGTLPTKDGILVSNIDIPANSKTNYYISYKYIYSEEDQNIDQGKNFSTVINVTLTK